MGEYVFRYAPSFGFDDFGFDDDCDNGPIYDGKMSVRRYYAENNDDHYGTIHEEIVRCRDCAFYKPPDDYSSSFCSENEIFGIERDDFCSFAARKESA